MATIRYAGDRFVGNVGSPNSDATLTGVLDGAYYINTGNLTQYVKRPVGGWAQLAGGGGGGGTPGGSNTQVQFNNAGAFGGDADLTFTDGNRLNVNKLGISGNIYDSNNSLGEGGMVLTNEGQTGVNWKSIESVLSGVGGSGVANYVARWSDEDTITTGVLVDNATNVGIGTASPSSLLHVYSADPVLTIQDSESTVASASAILRIGESDGSANLNNNFNIKFVGTASGGDLDISRYNSTTLADQGIRIKHDGKVGIGTTNPDAKIRVSNSAASGGTFKFTDGSSRTLMDLGGGILSWNAGSVMGAGSWAGTADHQFQTLGTTRDTVLINGPASGTNHALYVTGLKSYFAGKVGIGALNPTNTLEVKGPNTVAPFKIVNSSNGDKRFLQISSQSNYPRLTLYNDTEADTIHLDTNGVSYFNGGNVGIGTTSPVGILHASDVSDFYLDLDGTDSAIVFKEGGGNSWRIGNRASGDKFNITQNATSLGSDVRFTIANGGNVGIGSTVPAFNLDVTGTGRYTGLLNLNGGIYFQRESAISYGTYLKGSSFQFPQSPDAYYSLGKYVMNTATYSYDTLTGYVVVGYGTPNTSNSFAKINFTVYFRNNNSLATGSPHVTWDYDVEGEIDFKSYPPFRVSKTQDINNGAKTYELQFSVSQNYGTAHWLVSSSNVNTTSNTLTIFDTALGIGTAISDSQVKQKGFQSYMGSVGIGTIEPYHAFHVSGDAIISGKLYDAINSTGDKGYVLTSDDDGPIWAASGDFDGLSGNLVATGAIVDDISGNLITSGQTLTTNINTVANNLITTGQTLQTQITNNDTDIATNAANLITTGQTLTSDINALAGNVGVTGQTLQTQITNNDTDIATNAANLITTGQTLTNDLISTGNFLESEIAIVSGLVSGDPEIVGTGTVGFIPKFDDENSITDSIIKEDSSKIGIGVSDPQHLLHIGGDAIVSGKFYDSVNSTGDKGYVLTSDDTGPVWAASGDFDTLSGNLITTGQTLQTQITSNDSDISTLTSNLVTTGQTLTTNINTVSSNLVSTGSVVDDISGNLITTGQTLQTQITANDSDIAANTANLITTGQTLQTQITANDGDISTLTSNLITTGQTLTSDINALAGNVGVTGQTLQTQITSNDTDIAANTANLITTGQTLQTQITSNDGDITNLTANLITTGQTLQTQITANDGDISTLTTNLITTGQTLTSDINALAGNVGITGQTLQTQITSNDTEIATLTSNLVTTGQTLTTNINTVSANLISTGSVVDDISGNLITTGQTLTSDINALAGNVGVTGQTLQTQIDTNASNLISTGNFLESEIAIVSGLVSGDPEIVGTGTSGYLPKFDDENSITDSVISQSGSNIGINITDANPATELHIGSTGAPSQGENWASLSIGEDNLPERRIQINAYRSLRGSDWDHMGISFQPHTSANHLVGPTITGMAIDYDGHVGIGITAPSEKLHVDGAGYFEGGGLRDGSWHRGIEITTENANFSSLFFGGQSTTKYSAIIWTSSTSGNVNNKRGAQIVAHPSSAANTDLKFSTNNAVGTSDPSVKMTIKGDGNVGIGTTDPGSLLTISGNSDDGDNACALRIIDEDSNAGSKLPAIMFYGGSTMTGRIRGGDGTFSIAVGSTPTTAFSINTTSRKIEFGGYGSGTHTGTAAYRLMVDSSGNVIEGNLGAGVVDGSGTANTIPRWTDTDTIGDSLITVPNNTRVQINGTGTSNFEVHGQSSGGIVYNQIVNTVASAVSNGAGLELRANTTTQERQLSYITSRWLDNTDTSRKSRLIITTNDGGTLYNTYQAYGKDPILAADAGNVGIGTNSPQGKLDINTEAAEATHVYINGEVNQDKLLYFRHYANSEGAGNNAYVGYIGSKGVDNLLSLGHLNTSGADVSIMHLTEAGNVGIGTTDPSSKLYVNGSTHLQGDTGIGIGPSSSYRLSVEGTNNTPAIILSTATSLNLTLGNTSQSNFTDLLLNSDSGNAQVWKAGSTYTSFGGASSLNIYCSNGKIAFHPSSNANKVVINTDGDVDITERLGVGGVHSNSYQLYVTGNSYFSSAITTGGQLRGTLNSSITSIENFILDTKGEDAPVINHQLNNDLALLRVKGNTVTYSGLSSNPGDTETDRFFEANSYFGDVAATEISNASTGFTITLDSLPRNLTYTTRVGISFASPNWRCSYVKIEVYRAGAWTQIIEETSNSSATVYKYYNTGSSAITKIRYTLKTPVTTSTRIVSLFAFNYNSTGATGYYLSQAGGTIYGDLTIGSSASNTTTVLSSLILDETAYPSSNSVQLGYTSNRFGYVYSEVGSFSSNVGIGTDSPVGKLHIYGSGSPQFRIQDSTNDCILKAYAQDSDAFIGTHSNHDLNIGANSNTHVTVEAGGNIGIGTTIPGFTLDIRKPTNNNDDTIVNIQSSWANTTANKKIGSIQFSASDAQVNSGNDYVTARIRTEASNEWTSAANVNSHILFQTISAASLDERMRIAHDGNVGINTTTPGSILQIKGDGTLFGSTITIKDSTGTTDRFYGGLDANEHAYISLLGSDNTNRVYLSGGSSIDNYILNNVGIGTTSPGYKLDIYGSFGSSAGAGLRLKSSATDDNGIIHEQADGTSWFTGQETSNPNDYEFWYYNGSSYSHIMHLDTSGNVGIGTTNPGQMLSVFQGKIGVTDAYMIGNLDGNTGMLTYSSNRVTWEIGGSEKMRLNSSGSVGIGTTSPDTLVHMRGEAATLTLESTGNTDDPTIMLQRNNNTGLAARIQLDNSEGNVFFDNTYNHDNGDILFRTKGTTERVTIKGSGLVGIGTTNPGAKLDVRGNIIRDDLYYNSWVSRSINSITSGSSTINYILIAPKATTNVRLSGRFNCVRGTGVSAVSIAHADIVFCTDNDANPQSGGIHSAASDIPGYGHANFEIVELVYTSGNVGTEYYALKISPSDSWVASFNQIEFEGISNNITWTNVDSGNVGNVGAFGGSEAVFAYEHANVHIATAQDSVAPLTLKSTYNGSTAGPLLDLYRKSGTPSDGDNLGTLTFTADTNVGSINEFARIESTALDVTDTTEDGALKLAVVTAGTLRSRVYMDSTETVFNDASQDFDFRVESDNSSHALFVRGSDSAVGVGTAAPNAGSWSNAVTIQGASSAALELMKGGSLYGFMGVQGSGSSHALDIAAYQNQSIRLRVGSNAGTTAVTILNTGQVQLNSYGSGTHTGTAAYRLLVDSSGNVIEGNLGAGVVDGSGTANYITKWTDTDTIGNSIIQDDGNVGIGTTGNGYKLRVQGNVYISGTLTEASSLVIKENIETFEPSLDIINKIRPVKYDKKTTGKKEIGLIAEELAELFPELVEKDKNGNPSGVNYSRAVTVLLGGFKELYKEVQELKKRI